MKVEIKDASPDGLLVTFKTSFWFSNYEEAIAFIKKVDKLDKDCLKVKEAKK